MTDLPSRPPLRVQPEAQPLPFKPDTTAGAARLNTNSLPSRPSLPGRPAAPGTPSASEASPLKRPEPRRSDDGDIQLVEGVTFDDLLKYDYEESYGYLEDEVIDKKRWLQDYLDEKDMQQDVGEAREQRGRKLEKMRKHLYTTIMRQLITEGMTSRVQHVVREGEKDDVYKIATLVTNEILGLGPIEPLWYEKGITEIMVNGPYDVKIERDGKIVDVPGARFRDTRHLQDVAQQILSPIGRAVNKKRPYENGRLPDGSRVHIVDTAIAPGGPYITVRRFPEVPFSIRLLLENGSMSEEMAVELANLIALGCSTVVSGGTGSGKTSMLNALSGAIPNDERIITIEDNLEMQFHPKAHRLALEARRSYLDDAASITIRDLVRETLRMRPDRIVVGEVRDASAYDMLQAMTTGHDGSMTTVHSNDVASTIERLVGLIQRSGEVDQAEALGIIANGVDILVSVKRFEDGSRRVVEVAELPVSTTKEPGQAPTLPPRMLWEFVQTGSELGPNGKERIVGRWERRNELSAAFIARHRLDLRYQMTLEEVLEKSDVLAKKPDTNELN
jgi:pilus assembly protein CpaF